MIKILIIACLMSYCLYSEDLYRSVIPGAPVAPGKRLGGLWEKTEPKCEHDMTALDMMKRESERSAQNYRNIAKWSWVIAGILIICWYITKTGEFGGAAIISALFSFASTLMATLVTVTWAIVLSLIVTVLIALGLYLRKKSFFEWFKNRKKDKIPEYMKEYCNDSNKE